MAQNNPGDIQINVLQLKGANASVSCIDLMQGINIVEDITCPGMNIQMILTEDSNLMDVLPIVGEETLEVDINTPSLNSFKHKFRITAMDSVVPDDGLKTKTYMLTGVAEEVFTHKTTIVNKAYKTQLSKVVEDILKNYLKTQKQVFTEPTKGIQEYIVTDKRPFAAIKDILVRSVSERRKSSAYVFFEDHNGFNFCTMEFLFSMDPVARFTNYTSPAYSIIPSNFRNIYGYTLPDTFDTAMKLGRGAFTSTLKYIDLETQNYSTKDVSPDVKSMKRGESPLSSSDRFKQLFSNSGMVQYIPKDMRKPDTYIDEMLPNRAAYAAELDQQRLHIAILGDSTLSVGQKIYVELMNVDGTTGPKRPDPLLAADYIITKLIHIIRPVDAQPRYTQSAELMIAAYKRQV